MNELIVNADGTTTVVGDAGSVSGILAELVEANTIPAERDADGVITKEAVVPAADTLAVEVVKVIADRKPTMRTVVKTPAVMNDDGTVKTPAVYEEEVVPDNRPLLKTHAWRVPKARTERLEEIRSNRNAKLKELDLEYQLADEGVHPDGLSKTQVAAKKVTLRDLPPTAESHLAGLNNTDDITAYDPLS
jgi:hypothetical protein